MPDLRPTEDVWEGRVRKIACPVCGVRAGRRCDYGPDNTRMLVAHTGRYQAAVDAGKVPAFAGGWRG